MSYNGIDDLIINYEKTQQEQQKQQLEQQKIEEQKRIELQKNLEKDRIEQQKASRRKNLIFWLLTFVFEYLLTTFIFSSIFNTANPIKIIKIFAGLGTGMQMFICVGFYLFATGIICWALSYIIVRPDK
ncbi:MULTISPECIES: hypothetical protein [unclassified Gilliamella]|uniref:hypothetical protein n=1 Tax=unclassified Gilliamella TaxID=2685620 RepID=UPI0018DCA76F|nr:MULTISPECIES: hypothetical protein [unclassified Gilliamella]MBI0114401.1 hypothetical protein [Gilliamella sp. W8123]MBI0118230.1 hypothetical protein [Gilliamella sp. W8129]